MKTTQSSFNLENGWLSLPASENWNSPKTLIYVFCSPVFLNQPQIFEQLYSKFPLSTIVGCSTSGEIHESNLFDLSISATFIKFEKAEFAVFSEHVETPESSFDIGKNLAAAAIKIPDLKGLSILADGLKVNGTKLVEGINQIIDTKVLPVGGGLAGDGTDFKQTFLIHNGKIKLETVLAIGFYGDCVRISASSKGGWTIFGPERQITKSIGNVLFEIDGKPALNLYKEYLGEKANELPASGLLFPLQISSPNDPEKKLVRTILGINEEQKSLTFAGDIPQGWIGQLMRANFDRVIDGATVAYQRANQSNDFHGDEQVILAVSCVGRRLVLGQRTNEEIESIHAAAPPSSKIAGFYSYGEIAPASKGNPCDLHNQTMTLFIISEILAATPAKAG